MNIVVDNLPRGLPHEQGHTIVFDRIDGDTIHYRYVPPTERVKPVTSEFDRKAAQWVRNHYPGSSPVIGTVEFGMDAAGYTSGAWANFDVTWSEVLADAGWPTPAVRARSEHIDESAWNYDATSLIRELVDMPDPGNAADAAYLADLYNGEGNADLCSRTRAGPASRTS